VLFGPNTTIKNLDAKEHGLEIDLTAHPVDHLTVGIGLSALNSTVSNVVLPDSATADRTLPQAPKVSGHASIRYEVPVGNGGKVGIQWLTTYSGASCFTVMCAPIDNEAAHAVSEARISYQPASEGWDVAAFVKNATNEIYRVYNADTSFIGVAESVYAPPRWFGVTASVHFGKSRQ
jgi:iron complex outermembrane receptor protein